METSRIEALLERMVEQNDEIISYLSDIKDELNWVGDHSFAKQVLDSSAEILKELSWVEDHSFAKQVVDSLSSIEYK